MLDELWAKLHKTSAVRQQSGVATVHEGSSGLNRIGSVKAEKRTCRILKVEDIEGGRFFFLHFVTIIPFQIK